MSFSDKVFTTQTTGRVLNWNYTSRQIQSELIQRICSFSQDFPVFNINFHTLCYDNNQFKCSCNRIKVRTPLKRGDERPQTTFAATDIGVDSWRRHMNEMRDDVRITKYI